MDGDKSTSGSAGCSTFFFQAEDGIRDLVRSRGLGDVYKRQLLNCAGAWALTVARAFGDDAPMESIHPGMAVTEPVSYTHLTLPTSDLV